jgi:hypothetical protein
MDKQQALKVIKETFENPFDKDQFTKFIRDLLSHIEDAPFTYQGKYIPDAYKQYIKTLERIGKFSDGDNTLDILVITLQKKTSLERARTMQRNFIAWYLNGSRGGDMKDAALVAYVSPGQADWRFSLVKMDYRFEKTESGKVKVKEEFTPARRWSFLVGANEKSHTAQSRLVNILTEDEKAPTLAELENAFDIETVAKEFFFKYRELFLRTKEALDEVVKNDPKVKADFEAKGVDTVNFAKKLLGQIVFLYFLQKKGWFGVGRDDDWGTGSKHFLRQIFVGAHGSYENFFNDILEPLFYEALRIDRSHDDDYYSRFNCKIPFLNGGLFDPIGNYDWVHADINLPNDLFSNSRKTKEGDEGDGILDVFDRYNFTVREDEPLEKEVAIDPELLGKAYEKFNAIRSDNFDEFTKALKSGHKGEENKFNKKFGVYYTPREIVHYMCKQSLIQYLAGALDHYKKPLFTQPASQLKLFGDKPPEQKLLAIDSDEPVVSRQDIEDLIEVGEMITEHEATALIKQENIRNGSQKSTEYTALLPDSIRKNAKRIDDLLANITVCDPAVGSGAFPVGMMTEIVRVRNVLSVFLKEDGRSDYEFKRRCIEHSLYGVDIDPGAVEIAKLRLWLSLIVDEEDIKNIKPLPNLDYRIMQGNSLISEFMGINFNSEQKKENTLLKNETDELIEQFQRKKDRFLNESNVAQKARLKEKVENLLVKIFETKLKMQQTEYFNRLKSIENKYSVLRNEAQRKELIKQEKEKLYKEFGFDLETAEEQLKEFTSGRQIKPFFLWNLYFSEVFHEKGGFDVVIANPPYVQLQKDGGNLANLYKNSGYKTFERTGDIYTLFYEKGLNILKNTGHLCFITSNKWMRAGYGKSLRNLFNSYNPLLLIDLGPGIFESATVDTNILIVEKGDSQGQLSGITLNAEAKDIGLTAFINKSKNRLPKMGEDAWFIGSQAELDLKEKIKRIGKLLKDWDVNIYFGIKTGLNEAFIIDTPTRNRLVAEDPRSAEILKPILRGRDIKRYGYEWAGLWIIASGFDIDVPKKYPAVLKQLKQFEEKAKKRDDQGKNWWNLRACAYYPEFEKEKVVWKRIGSVLRFGFDIHNMYCQDSTCIMTGKKLKYLCAFMNSKLGYQMLYDKAPKTGTGDVIVSVQALEPLLIPPITQSNKDIVEKIENIVEEILYAKQQNPKADTLEYEKQIDQMVYELYGLTNEEIKIVEGETA